MSDSVALPIVEPSQAGDARRIAMSLASRLGFNETERGKVGIVVTEIANNLVRHAREGQLLLRSLTKNNVVGIEILALDKGPGMIDVGQCLRDGYSTAGTPGNGLGAISRLSAFFDIHSVPQNGTVLLSQLWATPIPTSSSNSNIEIGLVCLPKTGEEVSGDAWAIEQYEDRTLLLVSDGLGHGPMAAQASLKAIEIFRENADKSPAAVIEAAHQALKSTRGAAIAIAQLDLAEQSLRFAGVGNISASVISDSGRYSMVSHNGTVGHEVRKIQEFVYQWPKGGLLLMHSDGLGTQWRLDRYPGLVAKHPSSIAGVLYRDFNRGRDDVTVLIAKEN
ncbi:SpoIIE family protein phosphatase [Aerosakkonema funiforme]|uniref:SpoIIE family protein phosphatase n=1 Tax=Aerosakkonema funiforme TaxID=1246630 RepID=UPI0035B7E53E